jgi:hypothetical protein
LLLAKSLPGTETVRCYGRWANGKDLASAVDNVFVGLFGTRAAANAAAKAKVSLIELHCPMSVHHPVLRTNSRLPDNTACRQNHHFQE